LILLSGLSYAAGPFGGTANKLSITGDTNKENDEFRWVATDKGLFSSVKGTWRRAKGLDGANVLDVLSIRGRVLALVEHAGLFVSDDAAKSWTSVTAGLKSRYGHRARELAVLALDRNDATTLYIGSSGKGFFKSVDRGDSWKLVEEGMKEFSPAAKHVAAIYTSKDGKDLFIGTAGEGILTYKEGAFSLLSDDLPEKMYVTDIAVDPNDDNHLAVASKGHGLWESNDRGITWKQLRLGRFHLASAVSIGYDSAVVAYFTNEGFVVARNGRASRPIPIGYKSVNAIVPKASSGWYAALDDDGVVELDVKGAVMADRRNSGMDATSIYSLVEGQETDSLWCGDGNGAYYSSDAGRTWVRRDKGLIVGAVNGLLWSGTKLYAGIGGQGMFYWNPEGERWEDRGQGMGTANTVYSMFITAEGRIFAGTEGGVLWTEDGGKRWVRPSVRLPYSTFWSLALDPESPKRLWAASGAGLYLSVDGGDSWTLEREGKFLEVQFDGDILWLRGATGLVGLDGNGEVTITHELEGEKIKSFFPLKEGVLLGTVKGLWMSDASGAKRLWEGAPVLTMLLEDDGLLHVGTDGKGVKTFKPRCHFTATGCVTGCGGHFSSFARPCA
jgi:ligand-binding sensor domain-containing protein